MAQKLCKYQETDAKLREIEVELSNSEERKKYMTARKFLEGYNDNVNKIDSRAKELIAVLKNLNKVYSELSENAKEFEPVLESCEDENEIAFLQKKADELLAKLSKLESEIGTLTEEMNSLLGTYSQLNSKGRVARAQYDEFSVKYKELKEAKKAEMTKIEKELKELEKDIDPTLMAKYKAKRADKMFPILFKLNGNMCGKCMMEVSMSEVVKLNGGAVIECDNCRSLIYKEV